MKIPNTILEIPLFHSDFLQKKLTSAKLFTARCISKIQFSCAKVVTALSKHGDLNVSLYL